MKILLVTSAHNGRRYLLDMEKVLTIGPIMNTDGPGTEFTFEHSHPQLVKETTAHIQTLLENEGMMLVPRSE